MLSKAERNRIAVNTWTARIVPAILACVVGYSTYVFVALLCVDYLLVKHKIKGAAIAILVVYFILFILMTSCFIRLVHITMWDPPYVPLGPTSDRSALKEHAKRRSRAGSIGAGEYNTGSFEGTSEDTVITRDDPDSPGLEKFYTKDVFICGTDGRPKWCLECRNWKPDRTHHCSDAARCIEKMDHFCPWVGGPVGENNYKFFIQFTGYTALYCLHILVVMAIYVHKQIVAKDEGVNPQFGAILGLASFFGLFTTTMTGTSLDMALRNETQVESLSKSTKVNTLAVLKPSWAQLISINSFMASHLSYPEIKYPLDYGNTQFTNALPEPVEKYRAEDGTEIAIPEQYRRTNDVDNPYEVSSAVVPDRLAIDNQNARQALVPISLTGPPPDENAKVISHEEFTRIQSTGAQLLSPDFSIQRPIQQPTRDQQASRTFAILRMEEGQHPWDLGSRFLNLQTVMGTRIVDWFLPIKRSPCCNHESTDSHFQIGPHVEQLKSSVYFIEPTKHGHSKRRRSSRRNRETVNMESTTPSRRRKRKSRTNDEVHGQPIEDGGRVMQLGDIGNDQRQLQG